MTNTKTLLKNSAELKAQNKIWGRTASICLHFISPREDWKTPRSEKAVSLCSNSSGIKILKNLYCSSYWIINAKQVSRGLLVCWFVGHCGGKCLTADKEDYNEHGLHGFLNFCRLERTRRVHCWTPVAVEAWALWKVLFHFTCLWFWLSFPSACLWEAGAGRILPASGLWVPLLSPPQLYFLKWLNQR